LCVFGWLTVISIGAGAAPVQEEIHNGRIAYIRGSLEGVTDVASIAPSGRRILNLTKSPASELYVDVSPNGDLVAFSRFGTKGANIYTVPIKGGEVSRLTSDRVLDELPAWSPDSSQIAFVRYPKNEDAEIFVMDSDGSNRVRITDNEVTDADPRWSPDGTKLIYNSGDIDAVTQDIFLVTPGQPELSKLTSDGVNDSFAQWSPDGTSVVYASYRNDQWDLFEVTVDGTNVTTQLTSDPADDYVPEWSPDGTQLLFVRGRLEGTSPPDEVYVLNSDGSTMSVSPPRLDAFSPSWSPDGSKIVFIGQAGKDANWDIFTVRPDGTDLQRLTKTEAMEFDPSWAID
jgi:Tol biopolymer transport system component